MTTAFATNIGTCRYTRAYDALVFSADGQLVHNPTATKVWFDQNRTLFTVAPGQALDLT